MNKKELKLSIFNTLMATRHQRASDEHINALKKIDDAFSGGRVLGIPFQSGKEKLVLETWKSYSFFADAIYRNGSSGENKKITDHIFTKLLRNIADALGIDYDDVEDNWENLHPDPPSQPKKESVPSRRFFDSSEKEKEPSPLPEMQPKRYEPQKKQENNRNNDDDDDFFDDSGWIETDVEL